MATDSQNSLTPTAELFAANPALARAIQIYWFAQWYHKDDIAKTFALLGVDVNRLSLDDERSRQALLEFAKRFEQTHPDEQTEVEKVVPKQTVETGLTYAEKIYGEAQRKKFVEKLTDNYVSQLKKQKVNLGDPKIAETPIRKEIEKRVEEVVKTTTDPALISQKIQQELTAVRSLPARPDQVTTAAAATVKESQESIYFLTNQQSVVSAIEKAVLRAPVERKDIYAQILTALVAEDPTALTSIEGVEKTTRRAAELERVGATLSSDYLPDPAKLNAGPNRFFQSYATTGIQKAVAPTADFLMGFINPPRQWEIAESFLGKSMNKAMGDTDTLTKMFGEKFIDSPLFEYLSTQGRQSLSERDGSVSGGMTKAKGLFDDVLTPIIRGPIEPFVGTPDQHILDVIKLNQMGIFSKDTIGVPHPAPAGDRPLVRSATSYTAQYTPAHIPSEITVFAWHARDMYFSMIHKSEIGHHAFEFLSDLGGWLFHWGAKEGAKKVAGAAAKTGAKMVIEKAAGTAIGKWLGGLLGSAFGPVGTAVGLFLGDMIIDKALGLLGAAWGGAKNLISLSWILGVKEKGKWTDDVALVMAIVLTAFIPIIMLIVLFQTVTKDTAFLIAGTGSGGEGNETIVYTGVAPPISAITGCPVTATGYISQCPNEPGGSHDPSHGWSNAYDVAVAMGSAVYSTHGGYLVKYTSGIYPGMGTGYGNYVVLVSTDDSGKQFFTIYAHLLDVSDTLKALCGGKDVCASAPPGSTVSPQELLGKVDDTGNSTGPHLHYEVRYQDGTKPSFQLPVGCGGYNGSCN